MRKPTIYEALQKKLGRPPTNTELKQDVERILEESRIERATKGQLSHQKKRSRKKNSYGVQMSALKRAMKKNSAVKMNPRRRAAKAPDKHVVTELKIYAENTSELYPQLVSIQKNLVTKQARGTYDRTKAVKLFKYFTDTAAQRYTREYGAHGPHGSYGIFGVPERTAAAKEFVSDFETESSYGNYDNYLPKKYLQKKKNTTHFPRTTRGSKGVVKWFILDLYDSKGAKIESRYKHLPKATLTTEAASLVGRRIRHKQVKKVELSGPYSRKPNANTVRK